MGELGRPHGGAGFPAVAGERGAALQDEAGDAGVLDGGPHQQLGVWQRPGGVLHMTRVWAVHDWQRTTHHTHTQTSVEM